MRVETSDEPSQQLPALLMLAHELKTPLALIRQLSLSKDFYDASETKTALKQIELTAERSLRLVEALTRSHGAGELISEPVHLGRLCEDIAHELTPLYQHKQQTLQLQLPATPLVAVGNRELIGSVIFGLCDNALSYDTSRRPIVLKLSRVKDQVRIGVDDHSPLMEEELGRQLGNSPIKSALSAGGSGLGLLIATQFALVMEGAIGFRRHRTGGHLFYLDLPRSSQLSLL